MLTLDERSLNDNPRDAARQVAVLFSGGDAPGMNPFLRALVLLLLRNRHGVRVLGVRDGYCGLVRLCQQIQGGDTTVAAIRRELQSHVGRHGLWRSSQQLVELDYASVGNLASRGGTVMGAGRSPDFHDDLVRKQVIDLLDELQVETVVICGGNGSLAGAEHLAAESSLQVLGMPATIDNDVPHTDMALGVDTAINTLVWAAEHVADTAGSHHRVMVLETMGRDSGELARMAGLATGAEIVVTPERGPLTVEKMQGIADRLKKLLTFGHDYGIVLVAEGVHPEPISGVGPGQTVAAYLQTEFHKSEGFFSNIEVRASVLGHLQRGGSPTAADRLLAAQFAEAVGEAMMNSSSGVLGLIGGRIALRPFAHPDDRVRDQRGLHPPPQSPVSAKPAQTGHYFKTVFDLSTL